MKARSYTDLHDLNAMFDLLSMGCLANNGTHYVHRGDLQWWLFYTDTPAEVWRSNIRLWMDGDRLLGWTLLSPDENAFDVYVIPELRGSSAEDQMLSAAVDEMKHLDELANFWVADNDDVRIAWFEQHGFKPRTDRHTIYFHRLLTDPLPAPNLPAGFTLRTSRATESDARLRATASKAAFGSQMEFESYWPRTWRLMQSPIYVPKHELFVIAPNGEVASYCIIWTDEITKVGHFEPVGTHPAYQGKGLGKSLLFEALRRLKSEGMTAADLCTNHGNAAAVRLYESVGFKIQKRLLDYRKKRTP